MTFWADTSFLASVYMRDANMAFAKAVLRNLTEPLPFTAFHRLELRNALSLAVFQKRIMMSEANTAWADMETDIREGRLAACSVNWADVFRGAENLAAKHSPSIGARSLDVLHVAAAVVIGASNLLTFDTRQGELAARAGLTLAPA